MEYKWLLFWCLFLWLRYSSKRDPVKILFITSMKCSQFNRIFSLHIERIKFEQTHFCMKYLNETPAQRSQFVSSAHSRGLPTHTIFLLNLRPDHLSVLFCTHFFLYICECLKCEYFDPNASVCVYVLWSLAGSLWWENTSNDEWMNNKRNRFVLITSCKTSNFSRKRKTVLNTNSFAFDWNKSISLTHLAAISIRWKSRSH